MTAVPCSGPIFETLMREIDAKLRDEGKAISNRPMLAVREVGMRYKIAIPLGGNPARMPPELAAQQPLSDAIYQWYQDNYGDRLKVDSCPGRTALLLDGDLYMMRVPRFYGAPELIVQREFIYGPQIGRPPIRSNIVQFLEGMTPARAARLSDASLRSIMKAFERALPSSYILESTNHELMYLARGDVATAVAKLLEENERFGESKWASLQASEKALKAAIALQSKSFGFTHGLKILNATLKAAGVDIGNDDFLDNIQCSPGIRYGEEPCDRDGALLAHHASLDLVNRLHTAGARFTSGLGGPKGE